MRLQAGPVSRTRASQRKYVRYQKNADQVNGCAFCKFTNGTPPVIAEEGAFWIVANSYGYDIWDGCRVLEHLMAVPKRHVRSLGELTKKEKAEYVEISSRYESNGYSLYSRAPDNVTKSVPHQHTHLIRLEPKRKKILFYLRKPHLLLFK